MPSRNRSHAPRNDRDAFNADDEFDFFAEPKKRKDDRKARQLCGQIFRALSCALAGQCRDEILQDLVVQSVSPAPNASRLLVTVYLGTRGPEIPPATVLQRLDLVRPMLRCEVASAIVRKRAPELTFQLIPSPEAPQ